MGKSLIAWDGGASGIASGSFTGIGGLTNSTTEAQIQYYISEAATFSYLQGLISSGGSGSNTITFRDTGVDTSLTATRSGTGNLSDTTNSATVAAADLVSVAFTDTGTDPVYSFLAAVVSFSSGHGSFHQSQNAALVYDALSATRFVPVNGVSLADGTATEANAQFKNRAYTSWESLQVYVEANARTNTSTVNNRINGADGAASISIGVGVTGMLTDNTVGDSLAAGDLLCASLVLGTGVQDLTIRSFGATFKNNSLPKCDVVTQTIAGVARPASATENYATYAGGIRVRTQTDAAIPAPYAFKLSNPRIYLSANTYTANASYKIYKNATASITVTLTAATTGWFEDTTNTIDYAVSDTLYYGLVGGTSGSATATAAAVTLAEDTVVSATGVAGTGGVGTVAVGAAGTGGKALLMMSSQANLGTYPPLFGVSQVFPPESAARYAATEEATFSNLSFNFIASAAGTNTLRFRNNGATGNQTATRSNAGYATDATNRDTVSAANYFNTNLTAGSSIVPSIVSSVVSFSSGNGCFYGNQNAAGNVTAAGRTYYYSIGGTFDGGTAGSRAQAQWKIRGPNTLAAVQINVSGNTSSYSTTFDVEVNGTVIQTITVAPATNGPQSLTGLSNALADGDLINFRVVTGAGTGTFSLLLMGVTLKNSANTKSNIILGRTSSPRTRAASATANYFPIGGDLQVGTGSVRTLAQMEMPICFANKTSQLRIYLSANTYSANATLKLFQTSSAVMTTTLTAATTGWFENTTDTITGTSSDLYAYEIVGGTSGSISITQMGMTIAEVVSVTVNATGVTGTGGVGTVTVSAAANVTETGVEGTGAVGTVTVSAAANVTETGVTGTGGVGTVTVSAAANATETGVTGTGGVGTVTVSAAANVTETGVTGTGGVGTATVSLGQSISVTGLSGTGQLGTITVQAGAAIAVTGVQASGLVSSVLVWGLIDTGQTPGWAQINDGNTVTWVQIPT